MSSRPTRRAVLAATAATATAAVVPVTVTTGQAAAAPRPPAVLTREIPRTGERIPAVGLGMFMTFDVLPGASREHLRQVVRRYWDGGGRVFDVSPLYGNSEAVLGDLLAELGVAGEAFIANKIWTTGEYLSDRRHAEAALERSLTNLWRESFDVMQVHSLTNAEMNVAILRSWKEAGLIRHIGVTHHVSAYFPALEAWIRTGNVDVVQARYSIFRRDVEARVLPAAADHGVAFFAHMTMEKDRLHRVVAGRPLPSWAVRDLRCENWTQYFLKYVLSHPAVTCALVATRDPDHVRENLHALRGPLPDAELRARMVSHLEGLDGFAAIDDTPWYPEKEFDGRVRLSGGEHVFH